MIVSKISPLEAPPLLRGKGDSLPANIVKQQLLTGIIMINFIDNQISNQLFMNMYNSDFLYEALKYE